MTKRDDLPAIGDLIADRRLHLQAPDVRSLRAMIDAAEHDVHAAAATEASFPAWAEAMLYEAGLRSARVIVQAAGYRISTDRGHVTAIDAADGLTGGRHRRRFARLHRMRRRRHEFMYETTADPSPGDLAQARRDVLRLIDLARTAVGELG